MCPEESTSSCRPFRMVPALRAARRTYRRRRPRPRHQRRCHRRSRPPLPAVRRLPVPRGRSQRGRQEFAGGRWEFCCRVVLGEVFGQFLGKGYISNTFSWKRDIICFNLCVFGGKKYVRFQQGQLFFEVDFSFWEAHLGKSFFITQFW